MTKITPKPRIEKIGKRSVKDILSNRPSPDHRFIPNYSELKEVVDSLKKMGYRIVLTMGVYDLIHEGHALYLEAARQSGDILVVGLDTDVLTKKRKGPNRPIVPESERLKMLMHLRSVDIVTLRHEPIEKNELVKLISPDVLILSETTGDWARKRIADCEKYCGQIVTLPPQATTSTTARIRNLTIEGAESLAREVTKLTENFLDRIRKGC